MWGKLIVGEPVARGASGADIVHHPADVPQAVGEREPQTVRVELVAEEVVGQLADGTVMTYFTFNGTVPGPMLRVRVGDTVEVAFAQRRRRASSRTRSISTRRPVRAAARCTATCTPARTRCSRSRR